MLADLLIVGAGTAGITAAICAAERGKKVVVIEKADEAGGTLHYTAGHLSAAGTNLQIRKGIIDTPEEHYADIERISQHTMNPVIARKAVDLAPSTLNWLEDLGYPFHEKAPLIIYGHEPYSKPRTYLGLNDIRTQIDAPGKTLLHLLLPIFNKYISAGKIEVHYNTKMEGIEVEGEEVVGIKTIDDRGCTINTAKNYLLTTGGYASNPEFF